MAGDGGSAPPRGGGGHNGVLHPGSAPVPYGLVNETEMFRNR